MRLLKIWIAYLWCWPNFCLLHLLFLINHYSVVRVGACSFWGKSDFLKESIKALEQIKKSDRRIYDRLTSQDRYTFWYNPKQLMCDLILGVFSINDAFYNWKADGIVARLVEACYTTELCERKLCKILDRKVSEKLLFQIKSQTHDWLAARLYPIELLECYRIN